jgi:holo-[acyl-carrier protein] synthase
MGDRLNAGDPADDQAAGFLDDLVGRSVVAIGADLVDIDRIRRVIERQPRFAERVFTEDERAYCLRRRDPAERFAARFAAKEAVLKAIGTGLGGADFHDIEVVRLETGQPTLRITGRARAVADRLGIGGWLITLSHADHVAQAVVAALASPSGPPVGEG